MKKKTVSLILILCMLFSCLTAVGFSAESKDYGLAKSCEDGNILHCFNWTLAQIKEELPNIAEAGFTSVQTSPLQSHDGNTQWYWLYQPKGFTIGNELGSYDDLRALCTEAHKYGVKIIVDVVANHVAGSKTGNLANSVENVFKTNKSTYFHNMGECTNYNNRYDVTHKNIGMPDLNSENTAIQNMVAAMIEQYKAAGVDGIRWDAAKHISLPSENCAFWDKMSKIDMYQYGEILDNPAGDSGTTVNKNLMNEYAQYIRVTDSKYSSTIMTAVRDGSNAKSTGYWNRQGLSTDRLIYWAESHDTYSNTDGWTKNINQNKIDRAYAILGARADAQSLYLSRPFEKNHTSIYYGKKGSTHFTSKEVAAVNHFHNAMIGKEEKYSNSGGCYVVWRQGGAVIVSMKDSDIDVTVSNNGKLVPVGTYLDEVSGSAFTVTETSITGHIGASGIAVIYNKEPDTPDLLIGDTSLDEHLDVDDATLIQRHLDAIITLPDDKQLAADADRDGQVTIVDATAIQWYLAEMDYSGSKVGKRLSEL